MRIPRKQALGRRVQPAAEQADLSAVGVARQDAVASLPAHRQARLLHVPDGSLQDLVGDPVVYRQQAGLDSILQAAGRCNREGIQTISTTYVFSLGKEHPLPTGFISQTNNARLNMVGQYDWFAPETMVVYFKQLHCRINNFDKRQMQELLYKPACEFEKAANLFHLIDDQTKPVLVNWHDSMNLYQRLLSEGPSYQLMKQMAQCSVNIRKHDFDMLQSIGAIEEPFENIYVITNPAFYKDDTGLSFGNNWLEEIYII